jgi:hypothetical protein
MPVLQVLRPPLYLLNLRPDDWGYSSSAVPGDFLSALRAYGIALLIGISLVAIPSRAEESKVAFLVSEPSFRAELAGVDQEWNISFKAAGKVRVMGAAELAYWGRWRDVESGPQVLLRDGGVVRADVLRVDERQIVVGDATGLGRGFWDESTLPREAAVAVMLQPPAAAAERDALWKSLVGSAGPDDRLVLAGGEMLAGQLVSAPRLGRFALEDVKPGSERFEIIPRGGKRAVSVPAGKVIAVQFGKTGERTAGQGSSGTPVRTTSGMAVWMGLKESSLVRAQSVSIKRDVVTVVLATGGELKSTLADRDDASSRFWSSVNYLEPSSGRVVWLSDRESLGYKQIPFVSVQWPLGMDQSVLGTRLRAHGAIFRKGIGMPSASRVAYEVAGYRRFDAEIAIDEAAGQVGSVVFKVVLQTADNEWQKAYESPVVRGGDVPIPITVDLKGASRMALLVEFAERGDECDYADWLQARLLK